MADKKSKPVKKTDKRQPSKKRLPLSSGQKDKAKLASLSSSKSSAAVKASGKTTQGKGVAATLKKPAGRKVKNKQVVLAFPFKRELVITLRPKKIKKPTSAASRSKLSKKSKIRSSKKRASLALIFIILGLGGVIYFGFNTIFSPVTTVANAPPAPVQNASTKPVAPLVPTLPRSEPNHLSIPSIDIDTSVNTIGRNADGTIEVPTDWHIAGWYKYSPTPGEVGPAIIVGHLDNVNGLAVFWRLHELTPGQTIEITRADGKTVKFKVDAVKQFAQDKFPTQEVYGNINYAGLRLITCGGTFNRLTHHYSDNTVVYASLTSS